MKNAYTLTVTDDELELLGDLGALVLLMQAQTKRREEGTETALTKATDSVFSKTIAMGVSAAITRGSAQSLTDKILVLRRAQDENYPGKWCDYCQSYHA